MPPPSPHLTAESAPNASARKRRSNCSLTEPEKVAKRNLKKRLKQQTRLRRLETRLRLAQERNDDAALIERFQRELEEHRSAVGESEADSPSSECPSVVDERQQQPRAIVFAIHRTLVADMTKGRSIAEGNGPDAQHQQSRELLRNMKKGTQTEEMFESIDALVGYTRQKFTERALLTISSLDKLRPVAAATATTVSTWKRLMLVSRVCSIGCGPGCDAVGALSFLHSLRREDDELHTPVVVDELLLLDYVIHHWRRAVLQSLERQVVPALARHTTTMFCDVRRSLINHDANRTAHEWIQRRDGVCLILVSYVITETRGEWHQFFVDLVRTVESGTLLMISEPTAWQLHEMLSLCSEYLAFHEWLDSSREHSELQPLEGRIGPAVVIASIK